MGRWNKTLQGLSKDVDFGTTAVQVKGQEQCVKVSSLFWGILNNIKKVQSMMSCCSVCKKA